MKNEIIIFQLPLSNNKIFRGYDEIDGVCINDYVAVWSEEAEFDNECMDNFILEQIYTKFNINRPRNFAGHSMSVSDIILIVDNKTNDKRYYYVDSFGFKRCDSFKE